MSRTSIRAVVFDMDGVMLDTERLYRQVGSEILARRGREMTPELAAQMMGLRSAEALAVMRRWHDLDDAIEMLAQETEERFLALLEADLQPMPGLVELVRALEEHGLPRAVATSSPRRYADIALTRLNLRERFGFVLGGEDVVHCKPHPEVYLMAAERLGVEPASMLVLEDSIAGLHAAKSAGAFCLVITHEYNAGQDFTLADGIVPSLHAPEVIQMISRGGRPGANVEGRSPNL